MKRKLWLYTRCFHLFIFVLLVTILCWFFVPESINSLKTGILGAALGVGLSLFAAEGFKKITEFKRRKKTLGLLKLISIPHIENQANNILDTMNNYKDINSIDKAIEFLVLASHFDAISSNFDKEWLSLVYSQDFLDAIDSDDHLNSLATTIKEQLIIASQLSGHAVNAKINVMNDFSKLSVAVQAEFIDRARGIRDDITESLLSLKKYTSKLDCEISHFLRVNGVVYTEFDR